jgi:RNA polymerase sigma-70 factor (ECF subfamily)
VTNERHEAVLDAVASLPALYREPFVLKHLEGWSYRQIGEALGLPTDTVETRLVRARRRLRQKLAGEVEP